MKVTRHDIGGELISIITKGMYADPKDALREYVQNGVDARANNIAVRIKYNSIIITDDGHGMDKVVMRRAVRVGISDKDPKRSVGFMGIGLYSSFHLCNKLSIYSKTENENPYLLSFNFEQMRNHLENQKDLRIDNNLKVEQIDLQTLLENNIDFIELQPSEFPAVGTRVEMYGLESNFFRSLSKYEEVSEYLERVIPLPFSPDFRYGEKIQKHIQDICQKHNAAFRTINLTLDINGAEQLLYRPYKDADYRDKAHPDDYPLPPEYYELKSAEGFLGLSWACLNSGRRTVPNGKVRGFIIKKQGFTIGKREDLIIHFGRPTYFNRYIGEFIALHPKLLPNGPRSDFEYSSIRTTFYGILKQAATKYNKLADDYQEQEKAEADLQKAIEKYNIITAQISFFQDNGDKLLEFFGDLNDISNNLLRKIEAEKFRSHNVEKAKQTQRSIHKLLEEIKTLLDIKKSRKKEPVKKTQTSLVNKIITPIQVKNNEPAPDSVIEIIELLGLDVSKDVRTIIELIDDKFVKGLSSSREEYIKKLLDLKNDIEALYESE